MMRRLGLVAALVNLAACGSPPTSPTPTPTPTPVEAPSIACPANLALTTPTSTAVAAYTAPVVTGGTQPVSSSCTLTSGTAVPIGTTAVTCTVTDAIGRGAECKFSVTVTLKVFLKYTSFWGFGDSITAGEVSTSSFIAPKYLDPVNNYPVVLGGLLSDRYVQQSVTVRNQGVSGERADAGADRLRAQLLAGPVPDVLLLLEGSNEMLTQTTDLIATIVPTLAVDIDEARIRGVKAVVIATFPPVRAGIRGSLAAASIVPINSQVRALASQKGVLLVDVYAAMVGQELALIGDDGLHPTVAGYKRIADTFMSALRSAFEVSTAPGAFTRFAPR